MQHQAEDIKQYAKERLCAYMTEHEMRHTQERFVILDAICEMRYFTIDELRARLTELTISRATVYNTLDLLEKAQLIQKMEKAFGVRAAQYELITANDSTVKVICRKCGKTTVKRDPTINRMLEDKRWANFTPSHFSLYIFGECKVCKRKPK